MLFQLRPVHLALTNPHPRLLIADAVGLGKTLEIGIVISDLIRRGRGEHILVVTPRAVLEQFQHEMWIKFAIPLVRLDSDGIQKVRQTLPASRNPFSYYRRVIVSIDTLKNPVRYRHHLASQRWDVVVMDECHNLINPGTPNYEIAKLGAAQTDALLLASATPRNGKAESFAELITLLDPTAIKDKSTYAAGRHRLALRAPAPQLRRGRRRGFSVDPAQSCSRRRAQWDYRAPPRASYAPAHERQPAAESGTTFACPDSIEPWHGCWGFTASVSSTRTVSRRRASGRRWTPTGR